MEITAVVLSPKAVSLAWDNWQTLNHVRAFESLEELHYNRLQALYAVNTEYMAYIDWDDALPDDQAIHTASILHSMNATGTHLVYCDWLEKRISGSRVCRPGPYNRKRHLANPRTMHQLVVVRTEEARRVAKQLPKNGLWHTEFLLYYAMCALQEPLYYPHIMYHWVRSPEGLHNHRNIVAAQEQSREWLIAKGY